MMLLTMLLLVVLVDLDLVDQQLAQQHAPLRPEAAHGLEMPVHRIRRIGLGHE